MINPSVNQLLEAAAITRKSVWNLPAVLAHLAPQFAVQVARMIEEAKQNALGKLTIQAIVAPESAKTSERLAIIGYNRWEKAKDLEAGTPLGWGSLGDIEFDQPSSPDSLKLGTEKEKYAQHAVIGAKPRLQWTGGTLQTVTLTFKWNAKAAEKLSDNLEALYAAKRERKVMDLVIGKSTAGSMYVGKYVIEDIPHTVSKYHPADMSIMAIEVTVNLLEWVEAPELEVTDAPKGVKDKRQSTPSQKSQAQAKPVARDNNTLGGDYVSDSGARR